MFWFLCFLNVLSSELYYKQFIDYDLVRIYLQLLYYITEIYLFEKILFFHKRFAVFFYSKF